MSSKQEDMAIAVAQLQSMDITSTAEEDKSLLLQILTTIRKAVSASNSPPISDLLDQKPLPTLIAILEESSSTPNIIFETLWILTNIASGSSEQTVELVNSGALDVSVRFLEHSNIQVSEQVLWLIGNVSGDSVPYRDLLLNAGTGKRLVAAYKQVLANESDCKAYVANAAWVCSNLLRGKPFPPLSLAAPLVDLALDMLKNAEDTADLADVFWSFSYVSESNFFAAKLLKLPTFLTALRDRGIFSSSVKVQTPALRTLGNLVTYDGKLTQIIVDAGFIPVLAQMYQGVKRSSIRREILWALSNIAAGTRAQARAVFDCAAAKAVMLEGINDAVDIAKEAAYALCNPLSDGVGLPGAYDTKTLDAIMGFLAKGKGIERLKKQVFDSMNAYLGDLLQGKGSEKALQAAARVDWTSYLKSPTIKDDPYCSNLESTIYSIMNKSVGFAEGQVEPAHGSDSVDGQLEPVDVGSLAKTLDKTSLEE